MPRTRKQLLPRILLPPLLAFGVRIKRLRLDKGLTQEQVASAIGARQKTVSRIESGNGKPTLDHVRALSILFGETIDHLLADGEPPPRQPSAPD